MKNPFNKAEFNEFRTLLIQKKTKMLQEIQGKSSKNEFNISIGDLVDKATSLLEEEMHLSLSQRDLDILNEIDEAIQRIDNNTYGICIDTQKPISKNRLKSVPEAKRSIEAQEKYEANIKKIRKLNITPPTLSKR